MISIKKYPHEGIFLCRRFSGLCPVPRSGLCPENPQGISSLDPIFVLRTWILKSHVLSQDFQKYKFLCAFSAIQRRKIPLGFFLILPRPPTLCTCGAAGGQGNNKWKTLVFYIVSCRKDAVSHCLFRNKKPLLWVNNQNTAAVMG